MLGISVVYVVLGVNKQSENTAPLKPRLHGASQILYYFITIAELRVSVCSLLQGKKERRRYSINRSFFGDYINLEAHPELRKLLNDKRERVEFADVVTKYDRRGKVDCPTPSVMHTFDFSLFSCCTISKF